MYIHAGLLCRLPSLARQSAEVQACVVERLCRRIVWRGAQGDHWWGGRGLHRWGRVCRGRGAPLESHRPSPPAPQALPGEFIVVENTAADAVFFLVKGKVKLTCGGAEICLYGPGSYFGDIDVLFTPLRVASVQVRGARRV